MEVYLCAHTHIHTFISMSRSIVGCIDTDNIGTPVFICIFLRDFSQGSENKSVYIYMSEREKLKVNGRESGSSNYKST